MTQEEKNRIDQDIRMEDEYYARERVKRQKAEYASWLYDSFNKGLISEDTLEESLEWNRNHA